MLDAEVRRAGSTNLWDDAKAAGMSEPELLLYRSNLLGCRQADHQLRRRQHLGQGDGARPADRREVEVLWVKGSGGDIGTIRLDGFATLYMDKLQALKGLYRGVEHEDEMVGYLPHCTFDLNPRAASIDTPLHAYVPRTHVDHVHPDAIIAIAASKDSRALTAEIFGDEIGWLPWKRPGFELGLWLGEFCRENPAAKGVVLESHGLFTWGDDAKGCYETTLEIINRAIDLLEERTAGVAAFGGAGGDGAAGRGAAARGGAADAGDPRHGLGASAHGRPFRRQRGGARVRGRQGHGARWRRWARPAPTISCAPRSARWWSTSTPRSRTSTRRWRGSPAAVEAYRADYAGYYERCRRPDSPAMRDPNAVVYLVPGVGMITFARDKATARISGEFYVNAINVMRGASAVSEYRGPARAGGVRHRVLAARGGEAPAHAQAEVARRPGRDRHRRRRRHRLGDGRALPARGRLRGAGRHRRRRAGRDRGEPRRATSAPTWCARPRWT